MSSHKRFYRQYVLERIPLLGLPTGDQSASFLDDSQDKFYHPGRTHSSPVADYPDFLFGCCFSLA
jgi:hypothetical protein